jgi:hypothetical protein
MKNNHLLINKVKKIYKIIQNNNFNKVINNKLFKLLKIMIKIFQITKVA